MRIAVIRALPGLGDMLCAVPALRSLRAGAPDAEITVVGLPTTRWFGDRFGPLVDRWIDLPWWPTIIEAVGDPADTVALLASDALPFDLVVQMQGSGGVVNRLATLLAGCGVAAVHESGLADRVTIEEGGRCGTYVERRWPERGHEIERLCGLVRTIGFPDAGAHLEWPERPGEDAASRLVGERVAVVHPGASRPDRRWDPVGFAATARALHESGHAVVVTGSWPETDLVADVARSSGVGPRTLTDLPLPQVAAVLRRAAVTVVNDTGIAHLSVAVGTPTVVVGTTSDLDRWGPLDRVRNAALTSTGDLRADVAAVVRSALAISR